MSSLLVSRVGLQRGFCGKPIYSLNSGATMRALCHLKYKSKGVAVEICRDSCGEGLVSVSAVPGMWLPLLSPWFVLFSRITWHSPAQGVPSSWGMKEVLGFTEMHLRWMATSRVPGEISSRRADLSTGVGATVFLRLLRCDPELMITREILDPFCDVWSDYLDRYNGQCIDGLLERVRGKIERSFSLPTATSGRVNSE